MRVEEALKLFNFENKDDVKAALSLSLSLWDDGKLYTSSLQSFPLQELKISAYDMLNIHISILNCALRLDDSPLLNKDS